MEGQAGQMPYPVVDLGQRGGFFMNGGIPPNILEEDLPRYLASMMTLQQTFIRDTSTSDYKHFLKGGRFVWGKDGYPIVSMEMTLQGVGNLPPPTPPPPPPPRKEKEEEIEFLGEVKVEPIPMDPDVPPRLEPATEDLRRQVEELSRRGGGGITISHDQIQQDQNLPPCQAQQVPVLQKTGQPLRRPLHSLQLVEEEKPVEEEDIDVVGGGEGEENIDMDISRDDDFSGTSSSNLSTPTGADDEDDEDYYPSAIEKLRKEKGTANKMGIDKNSKSIMKTRSKTHPQQNPLPPRRQRRNQKPKY